jgi:hypothetical protein
MVTNEKSFSSVSAPKIVIYDNACSLHNYVLNRDPVFFKDTVFVVDRLHWKNHSGNCFLFGITLYSVRKDLCKKKTDLTLGLIRKTISVACLDAELGPALS